MFTRAPNVYQSGLSTPSFKKILKKAYQTPAFNRFKKRTGLNSPEVFSSENGGKISPVAFPNLDSPEFFDSYLPEASDSPYVSPRRIVENKSGAIFSQLAGSFTIIFCSALFGNYLGLSEKIALVLPENPHHAMDFLAVAVGLIGRAVINKTKGKATRMLSVYQGLVLSPLVLQDAKMFALASITTDCFLGIVGTISSMVEKQFERYDKIFKVALSALGGISVGTLFLEEVPASYLHEISLINGIVLLNCMVFYETQKAKKGEFTLGNLNFAMMGIVVRLFELLVRRH